MRIGHGYDVHRFADTAERALVIAGVTIEHSRSLIAHSDGDVAIHALCDALLGAAGLGDIGRHFPDTSAEFAGIDSRELLRRVVAELAARSWRVGNVDLTIIAQRPKISPHIDTMRERLAADLKVAIDAVNVKATTTERLGFAGREEGIATHAVALIESSL